MPLENESKHLDDRLEQALQKSKYKVSLFLQKENSRLKFKQGLSFSKNGGMFFIDQTLISFVNLLVSRKQNEAILIDVNGNPINIENLDKFLEDILTRYFEKTNDYLIEFKKLQSSRSVSDSVEW